MASLNWFLIVLTLCCGVLLQCQKKTDTEDGETWSVTELSTSLPVAIHAERSPCNPQGTLLTVLENGYRVEKGKVTSDIEVLENNLSSAYKATTRGKVPWIYLVADSDTPFQAITTAIRSAAKAGFPDIFFATKQAEDYPNILKHGLWLHLPTAAILDQSQTIKPMLLRVESNGAIYRGTGPDEECLDTDASSRSLPITSERLDQYHAGARAGGLQSRCQIWAKPSAHYQRVIDVMSAMNSTGIKHINFTSPVVEEHPPKAARDPRIKPSLPKAPR